MDYLEIEYSADKRPKTEYPEKLARHLAAKYGFNRGDSILEVGSGRAEMLSHFTNLGLFTWAIDSAPSSALYAQTAGAKFNLVAFENLGSFEVFGEHKFDIVFSKSFVEHIPNPIEFSQACYNILKPGGLLVTLTPDWEASHKIFFDDLTHIKPFSRVSMVQFLEYGNFEIVSVERFRQLPITWNSSFFNALAKLTSYFSRSRSSNKWERWSKELMLIGVGRKPAD
ncbi:SmtA SAM-dependent methyltransferases [Candidatus Nanopelagicaceae bacterium]